MRLIDSRRLMGPNLLTRGPMAVVEVAFDEGDEPARGVAVWGEELGRMLTALGRGEPEVAIRTFQGGAAMAFAGPIDELFALTDVNDWAVESASRRLAGAFPADLEPRRGEIAAALAEQRSPALLGLQAEAARRGVPFLWDDVKVSVGHGCRSRTFARDAIPPAAMIPWNEIGTIPVALITGTNGKTTSSRLLAHIVRRAGKIGGSTSTDGVVVGDEVVEQGDWTGPQAARLVLRRREVEIAVLETARGGILRRGLAVDSVDGALITNVGDDHRGGYGIDDIVTMARAKAVIGSVVRPDGRVVLNGDDPRLVALAPSFPAPVVFFSIDPDCLSVVAHRARGGEAWIVRDGTIVQAVGEGETPLLRVADIPIAFGGAAAYNVENALGVAALGLALGLPRDAIAAGLRSFAASPGDNPGRGHLVQVGGVRVMLDFGHNREAVKGVLGLCEALRGSGRLAVITGHAGDRSDEDFRIVARTIHAHGPSLVLVRDLVRYLRGRAPGEVPAIFRDELLRLGMSAASVRIAPTEVDALREALAWAQPGDFVLLLLHLDDAGVRALLDERGATPAG